MPRTQSVRGPQKIKNFLEVEEKFIEFFETPKSKILEVKKIRKQAILLMITAVFVMVLCGAVSAESSQGGNDTGQFLLNNSTANSSNVKSTEQPVDPEITLNVTLEHPEALSGKLPTVTVKDTSGKTITNVKVVKVKNNQYKVNFLSDKTSFKLTVGALGHVSQTVNVLVSQRNATDPVLYGDASVKLRAYNLLIISGSSSYAKPFVDSNKKLRDKGYYFNMNFFTSTDLTSADTKAKIKQSASKADLIVIEMISESGTLSNLMPLLSDSNAKIMALRCGVTFLNNDSIDSNDTELRAYWDGTGTDNMERFQLRALQRVGMYVKPSENLSVINYPTEFIYHPDSTTPQFVTWNDYLKWYTQSGHYKSGKAWVGIMMYASTFFNGNGDMPISILRSLEAKGLNVILAITASSDTARANAITKYFLNGNSSRVGALVACVGYNIIYNNPQNSTDLLKKMNVPIFAPIYASDLESWKNSSSGLSNEVYWQVAMPEMEGRIEPIIMGGVESAETDPYTGIVVKNYQPLPDRIERITNRVYDWILLQTLPNSAKKIAIIYYNTAGGKDGVGASYLNVPESISAILQALKASGYKVSGNYSVESIIDLFLTAGNNVGSWAPGELKKVVDAGAITIPLSEYMEWFNTLPKELRDEVNAKWGPAPGNVMVYDGKIVLPGIMLGNIFVGAQPMRGWGENSTDIAHSSTLPPTHQYIAFYMWLQKKMGANAVIHLGTHGTLEWLPGKSVGLGEDDWPDILLGDIPNIYPYIVDNTGEGTQAKRRGYAVIIDHLTAPLISSGLYGDLSTLQDLINSYDSTSDSERKTVLEKQIRALVTKMNLDQDIDLNMNIADFETIKNEIEHHLEDLAATLMPYGLHTFGVALNGTILDQMVESIVSFDPANRNNAEFRANIRAALSQNYEMESLLAALNGEFVSPSLGGDPIRKPDVLPTGSNFYSFDPRSAPDTTAWEIGKKMADDMLKDYYKKNGRYPETVGVVLWSTETMRTNGQTIAMILRYMGLEPEWKSGRFVGVKVTPLSELQRPRVDVVVTISGLFRDTFPYTIDILDKAFRQVANLSESTSNNFVKKHYQNNYNKYVNSGMSSKDADILAGARIFGEAPGSYGTGVAAQVPSTSKWKDQSDLVDTYLSRMSYIYGAGTYGLQGLQAFKDQLKNVQATVQVRDNNYGVLDNDDVYQYLGGLSMAVKSLSGNDVSVYIANTRSNPKIETLDNFLATEFRTRLANPKWKEGMLNEGFSGAHEIVKEIGNMFAWDAVQSNVVKDWMYETLAKDYMTNPDVRSALLKSNPYAYTSILGWMLEANRRNMWSADKATLTELANQYINYANQYGVTCCHHTCANIDFSNFVVMSSSLSTAQLKQFADMMNKATSQTLTVDSKGANSQNENSGKGQSSTGKGSGSVGSSGSGVGSVGAAAVTAATKSASSSSSTSVASGSKNAYEVSTAASSGASGSSGVPALAIIGVVSILCLLGAGYFKSDILNLLKQSKK
ncbi:cobaltochelatase subunit CobN [Methanobacterium veterum]|jgi:cobaltochelatase CobN|uniref:cobaltochelatase subunit CobN n=1 Tax=Methanobacterium veterum TaxID=408577 RepID=UPI000AC5C391|nr:cobaltochelatase subunit CobN [Methanobacterium veterum]